MQLVKHHRKKIITIGLICSGMVVFDNCVDEQIKSRDVRGAAYAGSEKCMNCHQDIYQSYTKTAHYLTSLPASKEAIHGSFDDSSNTLYYRPRLKVVMEKRDSAFYQVAYIDNVEQQKAAFDIAVGSGRKGQSYLYWYGENIFQLPVSYYVPGNCWINSPGYAPGKVNFVRNIPIGCFECHSSFIKKTQTKPVGRNLYDFFDKKQIIYGIDCERCHGPAAKHISFHEENPREQQAKFITTYTNLSRGQKLDMCGICHSGARQALKTSFYYKPGETVAAYLAPDTSTLSPADIDVHGNQYQLLKASQCFIKSKILTCGTCHDPHVQQRNDLVNFSKKCLSCHTDVKHDFKAMKVDPGSVIENNCIDCHMPAKPSSVITMKSQPQSRQIPALVRTHYIGIYR